MHLVVKFPNGERFTASLQAIGQKRLVFLRKKKAPMHELHMQPHAIMMWAAKHLTWSTLVAQMHAPPDPEKPYYRTMWSKKNCSVSYCSPPR